MNIRRLVAETLALLILERGMLRVQLNPAKGGIIDSIRWRGIELIDGEGFGRGLQVAWQYGDHGECANPTQGGSAFDERDRPAIGHSQIQSIMRHTPYSAEVVVSPAWWVPEGPGNGSMFCEWQGKDWGPNPPYPPTEGVIGLVSQSRIRTKVRLVGQGRINLTLAYVVNAEESANIPAQFDLVQVPYVAFLPMFTKLYRVGLDGTVSSAGEGFRPAAPILCSAAGDTCIGWYSPAAAAQVPDPMWHNGYVGHGARDQRFQDGCWVTYASIKVLRVPGTWQIFSARLFVGRSVTEVAAEMVAAGWPSR